jgi:hypothetical protein
MALLDSMVSRSIFFPRHWRQILWKTFPESVKDLGALWRDTGVIDEAGRPRPAYQTWKLWLAKPRE